MKFTLDEQQCRNLDFSTRREWLLPNGIGGYAMGTASGINTRRYHGLLVAAVEPPAKRMVLLAAVDAFVQGEGNPIGVSANQYPGAIYPEGYHYLRSFSVDHEAVWNFRPTGMDIEKRLYMHPGENACTIRYRNLGENAVLLSLRPLVSHKPYHENFLESAGYPEAMTFPKDQSIVTQGGVNLRLFHPKAQRVPIQGWYYRFEHARETERGLSSRDDLFCPCELRYELLPGEEAVLVASIEAVKAKAPPVDEAGENHTKLADSLREAADKFFVRTSARSSIIAGYPWFTDWGRDTMISIPGLCLHTGRVEEAKQILRDYAGQAKDGLIPNRFVEDNSTPDYNTVDATLWFVNAIHKTLEVEWDENFAREMFPILQNIFDKHMTGTHFGIHVDPEDGLLTQGEPGVQLTWMDAKIGDWVVTPRHGKPVEINGLWINACRILELMAERIGLDDAPFRNAAEHAEANFESKFWHEVRGHYLDTVDPADASLRPNQLIAMSLPFAPAKGEKARRALDAVTRELLTPVGVRTLAPNEPEYRGRFQGPLPDLDAAYHQGTVWPWLLGPYVSALVKLTGDRKEAKRVLREAREMLHQYGLGGVAECYDGDEPQGPGGCPYQAWSTAEILRAWVEDAKGD